MVWDRTNRPIWLRCTVGVLVAVIAAAIRWQFLGVLEFRVIFLIFYPAVAVAALYGGFGAGLLATVVSAALADYFWMEPVGKFAIANSADLLSMLIFLAAGTLISYMAEATFRAEARAHKAEEQSRLAAERERAAVELHRSESKYRQLVQNANSAIIRWKSDGTITFFNEYAQKFFGYSADEVIGKDVNIIVPEKESTGGDLTTLAHDIASHPEMYANNIHENVLRDGRRVWMAWTNRPVYDDSGNVTEILAVASDITERKRAEDELRRNQEWLRTTLSSIGDAVIATDASGLVTFLNPICAELTGWSAEEAFGQPIQTVFQIINEKTRKPAENIVERVLRDGHIINLANHTALITRDGREIPIEDSAAPIRDSTGNMSGMVLVFHDVTEKRQAQKALQESEARFRRFVSLAPIPLCFVNKEGMLVYFNDRFTQMFGYTKDDVPTLGEWWQLAYPDEQYRRWVIDRWETAVRRAAEAMTDIEPVEYKVTCKNGEVRLVEISGITIEDNFLATFIDVTERKRGEETLRTTVQRFQNILFNIFDGILVLAEDDRVEFVNQSLCDQFDIAEAPSDLIGLTAKEMLQKVLRAYADPEADLARIQQILSERIRIEDEEILMRNGRVLLRDYVPILVDEKLRGRMWQHRDISERKQMEEELRKSRDELELRVRERTTELLGANQLLRDQAALLDLAHDAIVVRGVDETAKFWNNGAVETYGFLKEEALGKAIHELLRTKFPEPIDQIIGHLMRKGRWEGELSHTTSSGKEIVVESRWAEQTDKDGNLLGILEINRDITARKVAEEALRANMARLELVNAELQEFAFVASHDLQEPLRKIQTFCDLAQKRCAPLLDSAGKDYLDRVINSAARMRQLLDDLLQFSRVATRPEPFKQVDLVKIVREATDIFEEKIKEEGGSVEIATLPDIEADETQLLRLFQNLIGNALKFRSDESPRINVSAKTVAQGFCEVIVKDNGIGFDQEFEELIFKPFQRLHARGEYKGTGMGLAICRKIAERHGGSIRVESETGKGSVFIIRLPLKQDRYM